MQHGCTSLPALLLLIIRKSFVYNRLVCNFDACISANFVFPQRWLTYPAVMHNLIPIFPSHNTEQKCYSIRSCLEVGMSEKGKQQRFNVQDINKKSYFK